MNSISRYLDDSLNIDNPYFKQMEYQIYSTELELNKAKSVDTEALFYSFLVLLLSIFFVSCVCLCHTAMYVSCSVVITCLKVAGLLYVMFS